MLAGLPCVRHPNVSAALKRRSAMKYYTTTTEYNCGIDLHARQMYACLMDRQGKVMLHTNIQGNDFNYFLQRVQPYRHDLTVVSECTFNWYWLADACEAAGIKFVLAHALYAAHIHGGKNKNDRIDSEKLAHLLRSNLIPPAYIYPSERRPIRALLRQRMSYGRVGVTSGHTTIALGSCWQASAWSYRRQGWPRNAALPSRPPGSPGLRVPSRSAPWSFRCASGPDREQGRGRDLHSGARSRPTFVRASSPQGAQCR
ncbi:MAG: IS110 family transposase [Lentisphaerae bacterium]|nr:IS110 family transposase [Lentisphaerota bacterium]